MENSTSEKQDALAATILLRDGVYLKIRRLSVCGDLIDASGTSMGNGNYEVNLDSAETESLKITDTSVLADKFLSNT